MALLNDSFRDLTVFYENSTTVIYKGARKDDGLPVTLKTYKQSDDSFRIKHEYDLLHDKEIAGAGRVLEVSYNDDKSYLVREDAGGVVLDDYIADRTLDTAGFLRLAVNAARALADIHAAGIVHCDIKPANILIHPETMEITYIDFGISFSTVQRAAQQSEYFSGTLEFMAPEQTGRLNMVVDQRSDLYSLGITLYYLLSRQLPFTGESAVEIIHAQTVLPPDPISQHATVDPTIEAIVLKLMEKSPKKRYQSAESLAYDLGLCLSSLERGGAIAPLMLGEKDVFASLEPGQRLFGKEKDMETLAAVLQDTEEKKSNLVLLHGPEGSGKSNLVNVFVGYAESRNAYLLRGRFDWREGAESYSGIRELFHGFELYAYNVNLPLPEYRERLLEELGENAGVLLEIIPSLGGILGDTPPAKPLEPAQAAARARLVMAKTLKVLCNAPYPYVLILDDLQYADENSLDLLLSAIESPEVKNCLMLLSYRDTDPVFLQKLGGRLGGLNPSLTVTDIAATYLNAGQIALLLEDLFDIDADEDRSTAGTLTDAEGMEARSLAGILHDATGGELDKLRTLLQLMYRDRQIQYDAAADRWIVNLDRIDTGVLQSLKSRYRAAFDELSEDDRTLLAKLACMGENFHVTCGALGFGLDPGEVEQALKRLEAAGWLTFDKAGPGLWSFSEKARFDLCYDYFDREQKLTTHRQIVENLYPVHRDDPEAMLAHGVMFTRQVCATGREGYDQEVLHAIVRCQLDVAEQYVQSANMDSAVREFENGLQLLGDEPFAADYRLAYELHLQYALCRYALQEDGEAEALLEIVLENARGEDDLYNAYFRAVGQYLSRAKWEKAKAYARRYLDGAGLLLAENADPQKAGEAEYQHFLELSGDLGIRICMDYPYTENSQIEHHGNILVMLAEALSFSLDRNTRYYLYSAVNLALENKVLFSRFVKLFPVAAARYASVQEYEKAKSLILTGVELAEKTGEGQAFLWCVYGNMVTHWVNPLSEVLEIHKKAKYHAMLEGNAFYEAYADMMLLNYESFVGENLNEYHAETMKVLHNLERSGLRALQANFVTFRQYARCLLGRTIGDSSFDDNQFRESSLAELEGTWYGLFNEPFYYVYRLRACYIHIDFDTAVEYAEKYRDFSQKYNMSAYLIHVQYLYYYSMALLELCRLHPERRDEYIAQIRENQREQKRIADTNPDNFSFKYKLVETGLKGLDEQGIELIDQLAEAHSGFMAKGLIWDAIFVERLAGNFRVARGIPQYEIIHKNNRLVHYKDIGAKVCIRILGEPDENSLMRKREAKEREKLEIAARAAGRRTTAMTHDLLPHTQGTVVTRYGSSVFAGTSQRSGINAALDFEALLGSLETLLGIGSLSRLTEELAGLLLKSDNAERVYLFLTEGPVTRLCAAEYAIEGAGGFTANELPIELDALEDHRVPKRLIQQVIDRGAPICVNTARNEYRHMGDAYLGKNAPESFLCLPIAQGDEVLGAIYMENASLPGAFPEGRVHYLSALVRQSSALVQNLQNVAKLADYTKDLEKRLSGYLAQQNALIAGIAHEINSPVGVCLTVATKMHEKTLAMIEAFNQKKLGMRALLKYLEETRDGLNIVNNNVMRAGDLVQNFKKMSVEQSTEVFEVIELGPVLRDIVEYVRPGVKKKIEAVDIQVPDDLYIYTSSGVLAQVFTNLIMNSSIHGFEDSPKERNRAKIEVIDHPGDDEVEIRYSDNGKGMDAETRDKVFQPFFTTKRNRGGSGLGGHIILTCVTQQLRGSVVCESEEGQGTTFIIRLPKSKPHVQEG